MPSADQVPVNCTHSTMRWRKWVVLIAGSTGSALRAVRPFQPSHHAGCPTRSLSRRPGREQAAQIAIALFADTAKLVLTPARVLLRHEPDPGREVSPRSECFWI